MNFTCNTQELSSAIDVVSRCLAARPVKESYGYIQIDASSEGISVSATDGAMYMTANIEVPEHDISEPGIIAMDGKLLAAIIGKQQENMISLTSNEKNCTIKCGKAKTQLPLRPVEDFPDMPPVSPKSKSTKIAQGDLKTCIDYVSFCTSNDQTRKVLTGVLLDFTDGLMKAVGLDGFRMAMRRVECDYMGEQVKCVVPKASAVEIGKLLSDGDKNPVSIRMDSEYLHVWVGKYAFSTVLLAGEYIDYTKLIREESKTRSLIDAKKLRGCVERAQVMASSGKNNLIYFRFADDTLQITSNSYDGTAHDEMDVGLQGEPLDIAFNVQYLIDMLRHEPDGELDVECSGNVSPAIVRPLGAENRLQIVLPVRMMTGRAPE